MAKKDHPLFAERRKTSDERAVIPVGAVAAEFDDIGGAEAQVVEEVGALGVADNLDALPRGEVAVDLTAGGGEFLGQSGDFAFCA